MIVYITARGHELTMRSLSRGRFGFPIPSVHIENYERLVRARRVPRATYIFADLERLAPNELRYAADFFRVLEASGIRCLNDPARAMARVQLLRTLRQAGINPFDVMRADEGARPARFPVFLRFEQDHNEPVSDLIQNQDALDDELDKLRQAGIPLRGVIVLEHWPAPYGESLWHKWGTFRVGSHLSVDHIAVDDTWCVKYGAWEKLTEQAIADEHDAVRSNRFAEHLNRAFDIAGIEFGRADHATVHDQTVVYEINTNPYIGPYVPDPKPIRRQTQELARRRFAEALEAIDTAEVGTVKVPATPLLAIQRRAFWFGWLGPRRP
jgi:hypothetical protein